MDARPRPAMIGQVMWLGKPLADATITLSRSLELWVPLAEASLSDAAGRFQMAVPQAHQDRILAVRAQRDGIELFGIWVPPRLSIQALGEEPLLDLASTVVAKKCFLKLIETSVSESERPESGERLMALVNRFVDLADQVRSDLSERQQDLRIPRALQELTSEPTPQSIDRLADTFVEFGSALQAFLRFVDDSHRAMIQNMLEGGPLVVPSAWQAGGRSLPSPKLSLMADRRLLLSYQGSQAVSPFVIDTLNLDARTSALLAQIPMALNNWNQTVPSSGGGSPFMAPPPPPPTADLDSDITLVDGPVDSPQGAP